MFLFKCKMCGGALDVNPQNTVVECEYCGTQQTLPKLENERRVNLFERANHFRRSNEFDKAMDIYEQILNEDTTDAEAYWSLVLCRYGIEYVEDPVSHKRIPTVNRAQFTSIFDDDNYKSALQYADGYQKAIYEKEAKAINEIQKGILAISQKEEPFDVFICYKETDSNGKRTHDSVLANELYHQLTQEGLKVFFSRITLEDKLGAAYEPYIFAALNSAKVMVVIGTKPEFFHAVWVKNEWSRYLSLIRQGHKKVLIPAYRDMDPYNLPEEFAHLQAQDMSKLGFMQDLMRGIRKIVDAEKPKTAVLKETIITGNGNTAPLLKRATMFLEDRDWKSANEYCEKVLDIDPENAEAYLGKLMAEMHVRHPEELKDCMESLDGRNNYQKAIRFADDELRASLTEYASHINARNHRVQIEDTYTRAKGQMNQAQTEREFLEAIKLFETISDQKDSFEQIAICRQKIEELKAKNETDQLAAKASASKKKKIAIIAAIFACIMAVGLIALGSALIPANQYKDAVALMEAGKYEEAIAAFEAMDGYGDSLQMIESCQNRILEGKYQDAVALMQAHSYQEAMDAFAALNGFQDSRQKIQECESAIAYDAAVGLMDSGEYEQAIAAFEALGSFGDSKEQIAQIQSLIQAAEELERERYMQLTYPNFEFGYDNESVMLEVHECRMYPQENGYTLFEVDYTTTLGLKPVVWISPTNSDEILFEYAPEETTTGDRETLVFEVETAILEETYVTNVFFQNQLNIVHSGINIYHKEYYFRTTPGQPVGEAVRLFYIYTGPITLYGIEMQLLDNDYVRFSLDINVPVNRFVSCYNPPTNDRFMIMSQWTTTAGRQTIAVDIRRELLEGVHDVNFNFFNGQAEVGRVYISDIPEIEG